MSYSAIVTKIHTRPHPNADRLLLGTCLGSQVVVGLETQDGSLGVFFPTDGLLSHDYCLNNNLYNASARVKLSLPEGPTGFFDAKPRVKAQSFRKERSDGLWMPLESLLWAGPIDGLQEGQALTEHHGKLICEKYFTPATQQALGGQKFHRRENRWFPVHEDTKQFRFVADDVPEDAVLYITEKLHGTQGRRAHVLDEQPLKPWQRFLNTHLFQRGFFQHKLAYSHLNGSHRVILEKAPGPGWYGTNDFRYGVVKDLTLHKGEIIYFEIVGWVNNGVPCKEHEWTENYPEAAVEQGFRVGVQLGCSKCSQPVPIMPPHDTTKTGLKDLRTRYGDQIQYTYGCEPGTRKLFCYKIVRVNEDGMAWELSWPQVVSRCRELGIPTVPMLFGPTTLGHLGHLHSCEGHEALRKTVESLTDGASTLNPTQIREGVVLRVESTQGIQYIKNKSHAFGVLEGYIKEQDSYVDLEEIS